MGFHLFSRKAANGSAVQSKLVDYLNSVDEAYMSAYATKTMRQLQACVSRECAVKVSRSVFGAVNRYFGAPKFRSTTWAKVSDDGDTIKLLKDVKFDTVKIGAALNVGVAEDYQEYWTVRVSNGTPLVVDISSV